MSARPYRIGTSGLPKAFAKPQRLYEEIYSIVRDPEIPLRIRARFKAALDNDAIRWELDAFGNVKIKVRGTDTFPGDVTITVPVKIAPK